MKTKSGKTYTKKQICEAIAYWKKQLNEDTSLYHYAYTVEPYLYITNLNSCFTTPVRKVGASHGAPEARENPENLEKKLKRYNTYVFEKWTPACQIILDDNDAKKLFTCEKELFSLLGAPFKDSNELFAISDDDMKKAVNEFKARHPTAEIVFYKD